MSEEWRPVVGYEGLYEVSNDGKVRSISRDRECGITGSDGRTVMFNGMNGLEILKNWPRYESGELVNLGDDVCRHGDDFKANVIALYRDGSFSLNFWAYSKGERVKRPAKVLDADGVEIRVGEMVWHICTGDEYSVIGVPSESVINVSRQLDGREIHGVVSPYSLTHRAPVLAGDGKPLRGGETAWGTKGGSYHLTSVHDGEVFARHVGGSFGAEVESAGGEGLYRLRADRLTHQRHVLDADGVPCCIGDEVWDIHIGEHQVIEDITGTCGGYETLVVRLDSGERTTCDAVRVSHRKPVLDAAGVPIKKGDTVYGTVEGGPFIVTEVSDKGSVFVDAFPDTGMHGSMLTHTKPEIDSWERIEEDAEKDPCGYFGFDEEEICGRCPASGKNCEQTMALDIVRRARALAERERGEA